MTDCTPEKINFLPLNRKNVEATFTAGDVTSDAGLLLLRDLDTKLSFTKKVSAVIRDDRHQSYVDHTIEDLIKQRVYAIACGYEDINDHDNLRKDSCFQVGIGKEVNLASSSTLSRFENSVSRKDQIEVAKMMVDHFIGRHRTPPAELILDFDPTDHTLHGEQQNRHYHGYYKSHCYLPVHVFCGDHLLVSYLRPSNIDGPKHCGAILKLLVQRLRQVWPDVKITFRGDAAFCRKHILYWCERNQVEYVVGITGNKRLEKMVEALIKQAKQQYNEAQKKQRIFGEVNYGAKTWKQKRRVIAKIEHHKKGDNTRFVVTTLKALPEVVYDDYYCPRGNMENGIKQLKLDFYSDKNSCKDFMANQFRLLLSSLAYILMTELRLSHSKLTSVAKAYGHTIRIRVIKIAAVILKNTRRIRFLLPTNHPYQKDFVSIANSLNSS